MPKKTIKKTKDSKLTFGRFRGFTPAQLMTTVAGYDYVARTVDTLEMDDPKRYDRWFDDLMDAWDCNYGEYPGMPDETMADPEFLARINKIEFEFDGPMNPTPEMLAVWEQPFTPTD